MVDDEDYDDLKKYKWHEDFHGYAVRATFIRGVRGGVKMHRSVLVAQKGQIIDHADRNKMNNQKSNLRFCSFSQNNHNRDKIKGARNRYVGVHLVTKRKDQWKVRICINGEYRQVGRFSSEIEAAKEYDRWARKTYGKFARVNFSDG